MISQSAIKTDSRVVAAGLATNSAVTRPGLITATGREAPHRYATKPAGVWALFALLPNIDYVDNPEQRPGCGFVGGRISAIAPLLAPGTIPAQADIQVRLRALPTNSEDILRELRSRAGLWSAPGALFARAAWPDTFAATFLGRLRENGDDAQLIVAHAQASLARRKVWLAAEWGVGVRPEAPLANSAGFVALGRALIDIVALVDRLATPERSNLARPAHREIAIAALLTALNHFMRHLRAAEAADGFVVARLKLTKALEWALTILDATGVFAVAADAERKRWERLTSMLNLGEVQDHAGSASHKLDRLSRDLERLQSADLGRRLECTCWRSHIRRSLLRLAQPDRHLRLALLARIRCDLIFVLAATRQLDRLYRLFPWLAALHGAFPGCAGGALGALASLYEAARGVDIGQDMKRRLGDAGQRPGTVSRMSIPEVRAVYTSPRHIVLAAGRNYAAGAALTAQVTSHVMVKAVLDGQSFCGGLSLESTRQGYLGYNDAAAFKVKRTREAVVAIQQAQPAFAVTSPDNDLIRHMGLTLRRHFAAFAYAVWPTSYQRSDFQIHRATIHTGRKPKNGSLHDPHIRGPWDDFSKHRIHQELTRSMLRTVDEDVDWDLDVLHDAVTELAISDVGNGECARAASQQEKPTRKHGAWADPDRGQSAANNAAKEPTTSDLRGAILRDLVDDVRRWRPRNPKKSAQPPQDDLLEDLLLGRANLAQLAPVSDLPIPILWFAPLIDRDRLAWIARGMPGQQAGDDDAPHAARIKSWLSAVRRWSWAPFASSLMRGCDDAIVCHLFTGVSSVTADLGHVR